MSTGKGRNALRRDLLVAAVKRVPLGIKLLRDPIGATDRAIFQMDIYASARFGEYVRIWPGAADNEIEVIDVDRALRQLILRVKEAPRPFTQKVSKYSGVTRADVDAQLRETGGRVLSEDKLAWLLELWTSADERFLLCGKIL